MNKSIAIVKVDVLSAVLKRLYGFTCKRNSNLGSEGFVIEELALSVKVFYDVPMYGLEGMECYELYDSSSEDLVRGDMGVIEEYVLTKISNDS